MCGENGLHAVIHVDVVLSPGGGNAFRTTVLSLDVLEVYWKLRVVVIIIIISYDIMIIYYMCFGIKLYHCMEVYSCVATTYT